MCMSDYVYLGVLFRDGTKYYIHPETFHVRGFKLRSGEEHEKCCFADQVVKQYIKNEYGDILNVDKFNEELVELITNKYGYVAEHPVHHSKPCQNDFTIVFEEMRVVVEFTGLEWKIIENCEKLVDLHFQDITEYNAEKYRKRQEYQSLCDEYEEYTEYLCRKNHVKFADFQVDIIKKCLGTTICPGMSYEFMRKVLKEMQKKTPSMTMLENNHCISNTMCHLWEIPINFSTSGKKRSSCEIRRYSEQEFQGKNAHGSIYLGRGFSAIYSLVFPPGYTPVWYTANGMKYAISDSVLEFSTNGCEWIMEFPIHRATYCQIEVFFKETNRSNRDIGYIKGYQIPMNINERLLKSPVVINGFSDPTRRLLMINGTMIEAPL